MSCSVVFRILGRMNRNKLIKYTQYQRTLISLSKYNFAGGYNGFFIDSLGNKKEKGFASTLQGLEMNYNNMYEQKLYKIANENIEKSYSNEEESGSIQNPIVINSVDNEEFYLNSRYGDGKWIKIGRELCTRDGIRFLKFSVKIIDTDKDVDIYFDISNFPGKWAY
mmetsp:Transcript_33609/g.41364  ORF Transcript_33609/g.41364 Transcript_33609/m.41364 type:complete len:166 (+) Transcript_33609:53-550(+)